MAYLVVQIQTNPSIDDLNGTCNQITKPDESLQACVNLLYALIGGNQSGTVTIVSKDASTSISQSGTNSQTNVFTF